jgi:[protein-PII] uridylyltransferase
MAYLPHASTFRMERASELKRFLTDKRAVYRAEQRQGSSALLLAKNYAQDVESVISALFNDILALLGPAAPPACLVALGGLARRELAPFADIDLAIVSPTPDAADVIRLADSLFYILWDAKLEVGHALRSPQDFRKLADEDDSVRTLLADWRLVAGNVDIGQQLGRQLRSVYESSQTKDYIRHSLAQWSVSMVPATVFRLEPDLKNGPGGLREIHRVWWMARLAWRIKSWQDLLRYCLMDQEDHRILMAARENILAMRLALHFCTGRRQEQLRYPLQEEVAQQIGLVKRSGDSDLADQVLEQFYHHAKATRSASARIFENMADEFNSTRNRDSRAPRLIEKFSSLRGRLIATDSRRFEKDPADLVRIFRVAQKHGLTLQSRTRTKIRLLAPRLLDSAVIGQSLVSNLFLEVLGDPNPKMHVLDAMHELGVLEQLIPELKKVSGLVQRDTYHTFTVDAHLVACAGAAMKLCCGDESHQAPELIAGLARSLPNPETLVLAALLHDIGKGQGGNHSIIGRHQALGVAQRLGLRSSEREDLIFLVEHHLLIFKVSQRRDLDDAQELDHCAELVGTPRRLQMLLVLSYVDALTTGPAAWNDWKWRLLLRLYEGVLRRFEAKQRQISTDEARIHIQKELQGQIKDEEEKTALDYLIASCPRRHWTMHEPRVLRLQLEAVVKARRHQKTTVLMEPHFGGSGWSVVMVSIDRVGLLADLAHVFMGFGVSVDAAQLTVTQDGFKQAPLAIDTFVIRASSLAPADLNKWCQKVCQALRKGSEEGIAGITHKPLERQHTMWETLGVPKPKTRIVFETEYHGPYTVVDVYAPDRVGLLFDIARTISEAGATIVLARISTEGLQAVDAFYLLASDNHAKLTRVQMLEIERSILEVLAVVEQGNKET